MLTRAGHAYNFIAETACFTHLVSTLLETVCVTHLVSTLLETFWRISMYLTDDDITKLYALC